MIPNTIGRLCARLGRGESAGVEDSDVNHPATVGDLVELPVHRDERGQLSVGETGAELDFIVRRFFVITDVPAGVVRAQHANRTCREALVVTHGACTVDVDDGQSVQTFRLDAPTRLLLVPAGLWLTCREFTADAALLVLASAPYDPADQIEDYAEFVRFRGGR
jgi:UDP-2-acetamido-3-amino-2,3-dideoxy-glucuronate N-acetyltransferase